jgi:hypothetical protein
LSLRSDKRIGVRKMRAAGALLGVDLSPAPRLAADECGGASCGWLRDLSDGAAAWRIFELRHRTAHGVLLTIRQCRILGFKFVVSFDDPNWRER